MFTAGAVSAALADLPGDIVYPSQNLSFENPVRPGQLVTATVTVVEQLGDDRLRVETVARTDEERVLSGEAVVLSLPTEASSRSDGTAHKRYRRTSESSTFIALLP